MGNKNAAEQERKESILLIKPMYEFDYEGKHELSRFNYNIIFSN